MPASVIEPIRRSPAASGPSRRWPTRTWRSRPAAAHARRSGRRPSLPGSASRSVPRRSPPRRRRASRASNPSRSRTNSAPGRSSAPNAAHSPPESPPAHPLIGTPRGSRGSSAAIRRSLSVSRPPPPRPPPSADRRPAPRPRTASSRRRAPRSRCADAAALPQRLDRAAAAVGRGAATRRQQHPPRPRLDRGSDQLPGPVAARRLGVALAGATSGSPEAAAVSITAVSPPPSSTSSPPSAARADRAPARPRLTADRRPHRRRRPLAPVGHRTEVHLAARRDHPRADRRRHLERREVPLNESGQHNTRIPPILPG